VYLLPCNIALFWNYKDAALTIEWLVTTAGFIELDVGAYSAFLIRPDKFEECEFCSLFRNKMEQYGASSNDDYTIIERMLYSVRTQVIAFKGCIGFGVDAEKDLYGNEIVLGQRPM